MKRQWKRRLACVLAILLGFTSGLGGTGFGLTPFNSGSMTGYSTVEAAEDESTEAVEEADAADSDEPSEEDVTNEEESESEDIDEAGEEEDLSISDVAEEDEEEVVEEIEEEEVVEETEEADEADPSFSDSSDESDTTETEVVEEETEEEVVEEEAEAEETEEADSDAAEVVEEAEADELEAAGAITYNLTADIALGETDGKRYIGDYVPIIITPHMTKSVEQEDGSAGQAVSVDIKSLDVTWNSNSNTSTDIGLPTDGGGSGSTALTTYTEDTRYTKGYWDGTSLTAYAKLKAKGTVDIFASAISATANEEGATAVSIAAQTEAVDIDKIYPVFDANALGINVPVKTMAIGDKNRTATATVTMEKPANVSYVKFVWTCAELNGSPITHYVRRTGSSNEISDTLNLDFTTAGTGKKIEVNATAYQTGFTTAAALDTAFSNWESSTADIATADTNKITVSEAASARQTGITIQEMISKVEIDSNYNPSVLYIDDPDTADNTKDANIKATVTLRPDSNTTKLWTGTSNAQFELAYKKDATGSDPIENAAATIAIKSITAGEDAADGSPTYIIEGVAKGTIQGTATSGNVYVVARAKKSDGAATPAATDMGCFVGVSTGKALEVSQNPVLTTGVPAVVLTETGKGDNKIPVGGKGKLVATITPNSGATTATRSALKAFGVKFSLSGEDASKATIGKTSEIIVSEAETNGTYIAETTFTAAEAIALGNLTVKVDVQGYKDAAGKDKLGYKLTGQGSNASIQTTSDTITGLEFDYGETESKTETASIFMKPTSNTLNDTVEPKETATLNASVKGTIPNRTYLVMHWGGDQTISVDGNTVVTGDYFAEKLTAGTNASADFEIVAGTTKTSGKFTGYVITIGGTASDDDTDKAAAISKTTEYVAHPETSLTDATMQLSGIKSGKLTINDNPINTVTIAGASTIAPGVEPETMTATINLKSGYKYSDFDGFKGSWDLSATTYSTLGDADEAAVGTVNIKR